MVLCNLFLIAQLHLLNLDLFLKPHKAPAYYSYIHLKACNSEATMKYSATAVKLIGKVCSYASEECES